MPFVVYALHFHNIGRSMAVVEARLHHVIGRMLEYERSSMIGNHLLFTHYLLVRPSVSLFRQVDFGSFSKLPIRIASPRIAVI